MTLSTADILTRAADLIEPEGAWTQGASARDQDGGVVTHRDVRAVCWCALGASDRCSLEAGSEPRDAAHAFRLSLGVKSAADWNDAPGRTQAEVVAALRLAATRASECGW